MRIKINFNIKRLKMSLAAGALARCVAVRVDRPESPTHGPAASWPESRTPSTPTSGKTQARA